jgi:hypothetical protein
VILGRAFGAVSPVATPWETLYADIALEAGAQVAIPADSEERGLYIVSGAVEIAGETFGEGKLLVFRPGDPVALRGVAAARLMLVGGAPMDGPRHIWWNFVSSSQERIRAAREDWMTGRFAPVPGETEFIPLP